jgi:ornithine cyclodeaminase/alanine dehydrogenase-like protein (mu-crystallin family)
MDILMLNEMEVQRLLDPDALLDALAEGFRAQSSGLVDAPKRIGVSVPNTGLVLAMPASSIIVPNRTGLVARWCSKRLARRKSDVTEAHSFGQAWSR